MKLLAILKQYWLYVLIIVVIISGSVFVIAWNLIESTKTDKNHQQIEELLATQTKCYTITNKSIDKVNIENTFDDSISFGSTGVFTQKLSQNMSHWWYELSPDDTGATEISTYFTYDFGDAHQQAKIKFQDYNNSVLCAEKFYSSTIQHSHESVGNCNGNYPREIFLAENQKYITNKLTNEYEITGRTYTTYAYTLTRLECIFLDNSDKVMLMFFQYEICSSSEKDIELLRSFLS